MAIEVRLPDLGTGVPQARLVAWLKREGDAVVAGEPIAEVETDKTTVEIPSPGAGVLERILIGAGTDNVPLDALLALIGAGHVQAAETAPPPLPGTVSARGSTSVAVASATPGGEAVRSAPPPAAPVPPSDGPRPTASMFVQRMAEAAGIPLVSLRGSGDGGRIMRRDVEAMLTGGSQATRVPRPEPPSTAAPVEPISTLRRVTGERLTLAKQTIPHFYLRAECRMDAVARARAEFNARGGVRLSFTPFVVRAAALALRDVPAANTLWLDGSLRSCPTVDIAVAVMTPGGLIAPVIRRADERSVVSAADALNALAERARAGRLTPDEYSGGSFTISNLGMYGVTGLYPIINPPQTCILGVGAVEERAVAQHGQLAAGWMMTCTLSADHRALDGATGAEFLAAFRKRIEDPWQLMF